MRLHRHPGHDCMEIIDASTVSRQVTVTPGMCGAGLFAGRVGDWTWETVSALCGTNVFAARNRQDEPAYLSFYYFRVRGSRRFHVGSLTFGDRLRVRSGLFDFGSESILTLHTVRRTVSTTDDRSSVDPDEFYRYSDENCIYVENFNRWVSRGSEGSNVGLVRASPPDFRHDTLPSLPMTYSPRARYDVARTRRTFLDEDPVGRTSSGETTFLEYPVDASRDLNGVGLLYFAAYFSIIDWALLRHWRRAGRGVRAFIDRIVLDQQLCYLGNVDPDAVLRIEVSGWEHPGRPGDEIVTVVMDNRDTGQPVAVSTIHVLAGAGA